MSNHERLRAILEQFQIDFHHLLTEENKTEIEERELELLQKSKIELVILAEYMQILSPDLVARFSNIIKSHHSFLPAFAGAKPDRHAHARGVKIIGATAHYVTEVLDIGSIIE